MDVTERDGAGGRKEVGDAGGEDGEEGGGDSGGEEGGEDPLARVVDVAGWLMDSGCSLLWDTNLP